MLSVTEQPLRAFPRRSPTYLPNEPSTLTCIYDGRSLSRQQACRPHVYMPHTLKRKHHPYPQPAYHWCQPLPTWPASSSRFQSKLHLLTTLYASKTKKEEKRCVCEYLVKHRTAVQKPQPHIEVVKRMQHLVTHTKCAAGFRAQFRARRETELG